MPCFLKSHLTATGVGARITSTSDHTKKFIKRESRDIFELTYFGLMRAMSDELVAASQAKPEMLVIFSEADNIFNFGLQQQ